ncbi:diol dehydratase small subunit [Blastococcus sp. SYSU DS0510]
MSTPPSRPLTPADYPLSINRPDLLRTPTGKSVSDLTMAAVVSGELSADDLRIAPQTLELQAQLAEASGRPQLAANFRRAAEMAVIPDVEVLQMYNALRPRASTGAELRSLADRLEGTYSAPTCAGLVREAAEVYARRRLLAPDAATDADGPVASGDVPPTAADDVAAADLTPELSERTPRT